MRGEGEGYIGNWRSTYIAHRGGWDYGGAGGVKYWARFQKDQSRFRCCCTCTQCRIRPYKAKEEPTLPRDSGTLVGKLGIAWPGICLNDFSRF